MDPRLESLKTGSERVTSEIREMRQGRNMRSMSFLLGHPSFRWKERPRRKNGGIIDNSNSCTNYTVKT